MNPESGNPGKVVPFNYEAEIYVIASLIMQPASYDKLLNYKLFADDFYDNKNKIIYSAIMDLKNRDKPIDIISLTEYLNSINKLNQAGGAEYVSSLIDKIPTAAYVEFYGDLVKKKSMLRNLITVSTEIISRSYSNPEDVKGLVDEAERKIFDINQEVCSNSFVHIKNIVSETISNYSKNQRNSGQYSGVPSGYSDLDEMTDGFQNSEMIIIAARPSAGKTSFALNVACNMAIRYKRKIGFFSSEMSAESLVTRILCSEAKINQTFYKKGMLSKLDLNKLAQAADVIYQTDMIFDATPNISIMDLRSRARKMKRDYNIEALFIDYLQLISYTDNGSATNVPKHEQVAFISKSLKVLARELDIPVVALAQLSRNVEQRGDSSTPKMSDLKDSGSIEQDADMILFIHKKAQQDESNKESDERQIIIGKNRNGPTGEIDMTFLKSFTRFQLSVKGNMQQTEDS